MKKILLIAAVCAAMLVGNDLRADLVAGWDFQTTANGGTAGAVAPNTPNLFVANFGSGTMFLDGTNGSSTWLSLQSGTQLNSFGGTDVNAGPGFSVVTSGAASLALVNTTANGFHAVFGIDMTGYKDLAVSYATQKTATGFSTHQWSWSTDAVNWTNFDTVSWESGVATTFATVGVVTLASVTGLNNIPTAFVRLTVDGATASSGNNRLDNIQFNATAIPEPTAVLLLTGMAGLVGLKRRRV